MLLPAPCRVSVPDPLLVEYRMETGVTINAAYEPSATAAPDELFSFQVTSKLPFPSTAPLMGGSAPSHRGTRLGVVIANVSATGCWSVSGPSATSETPTMNVAEDPRLKDNDAVPALRLAERGVKLHVPHTSGSTLRQVQDPRRGVGTTPRAWADPGEADVCEFEDTPEDRCCGETDPEVEPGERRDD